MHLYSLKPSVILFGLDVLIHVIQEFFLGDSLISEISKKQTIISQSSTETDYRAIVVLTSEIIWLRQLLHDFGFPSSYALIYCDNDSTIKWANNPIFHECTKHI